MQSITLDRVSFRYGQGPFVFSDLSFKIKKPEGRGYIVGLMGDSGCGKSTLFKLLLRIINIQSGEIVLNPRDLVVSYVPQEPVLFEHLTPLENAQYFGRIERYKDRLDKDLFEELSLTLNMKDLLEKAKSVTEISGGQRQRLSLLRALSIAPDILLLDEPLVGLDDKIKESFLKRIVQFAHDYQILVLYISHHRQELELIADEILYFVKENGQAAVSEVFQKDTRSFFKTPPALSALYSSKHHETNVLKVAISKENDVILQENGTEQGTVCLSIPAESLHVSENFGWPFIVKARTDQYCFVKLDGYTDILILPSRMLGQTERCRLYIDGMVDIYKNGILTESKYISCNKKV